MKASTKKEPEDSTSINTLVNEIVKEQQKIVRLEGDVVASHIRIGHRLAELRPLAKKTWGRQLKAIGISPRVASRYLKIAQHWPKEIGLTESDFLPRLPPDLLKLEWICRVPRAQLEGFLNHHDLKRASRPQVIAAVREALGVVPPAEDEHDVEKYVQRFIKRLMKTVEGIADTFPEAEQQHRARELLATELHKVQVALKAHPDSEKDS